MFWLTPLEEPLTVVAASAAALVAAASAALVAAASAVVVAAVALVVVGNGPAVKKIGLNH